ncbi:MAG TPA: O-antigen ligase family protein [Actinomycetota bacterium]|nr:O-antigen ligase family protein [Actinomycetota bacterium]
MAERRAQAALTPASHRLVTFVGVAVAVALASLSGIAASDSKTSAVLPLAIAVGLCLGALALTRFGAFVELMLIARASLDLAKLSGTGGLGEDAGARALDPAGILGVLFLAAAALWLAAQRRRRGRLQGSPLRRALLTLMAAGFLSLLGTSSASQTVLEIVRIAAAVMMFVVLEETMGERDRMRRLLRAVYLSTLFPLAFTALGILSGNPRSEVKGAFTRVMGPFYQSNTFGRYLMLMLVFGVGVYPYLSARRRRQMAVVLFGCAVCLVLTLTLSALAACVVGLCVVGWLQSKRVLLGLAVGGVLFLMVFPQLGARLGELTSSEAAVGTDQQNTLEWRLAHWSDVLGLASENPVTGIGLGTTGESADRSPHNDFVRAYVEMGVVGLAAYVAVLAALLALARRALAAAPPGSLDRGVAVGYTGCAVAFLLVSAVSNVMSSVVILWYFLSFAAAASSVATRAPAEAPIARYPAPARGGAL